MYFYLKCIKTHFRWKYLLTFYDKTNFLDKMRHNFQKDFEYRTFAEDKVNKNVLDCHTEIFMSVVPLQISTRCTETRMILFHTQCPGIDKDTLLAPLHQISQTVSSLRHTNGHITLLSSSLSVIHDIQM